MESTVDGTKLGPGRSAFRILTRFVFLWILLFPLSGSALDPVSVPVPPETPERDYHLELAVMCERIKGSRPINKTIVFSASLGRAFCYNAFDPVLKETHIFHIWYYRDEVVSRKRLVLKPQRWETYTMYRISNKLRGPWRVEIVDAQNRVVDTLRFSVTD